MPSVRPECEIEDSPNLWDGEGERSDQNYYAKLEKSESWSRIHVAAVPAAVAKAPRGA